MGHLCCFIDSGQWGRYLCRFIDGRLWGGVPVPFHGWGAVVRTRIFFSFLFFFFFFFYDEFVLSPDLRPTAKTDSYILLYGYISMDILVWIY